MRITDNVLVDSKIIHVDEDPPETGSWVIVVDDERMVVRKIEGRRLSVLREISLYEIDRELTEHKTGARVFWFRQSFHGELGVVTHNPNPQNICRIGIPVETISERLLQNIDYSRTEVRIINPCAEIPLDEQYVAALPEIPMNEKKWKEEKSVNTLLSYCSQKFHSERKLRLFAIAATRLFGDYLTNKGERDTLDFCEFYAEGLRKRQTLDYVRRMVETQSTQRDTPSQARLAVYNTTAPSGLNAAMLCSSNVLVAFGFDYGIKLCDLLREIFPNPFIEIPMFLEWFTWNDGTVPRIIRGIHERGDYSNLPILADALEEAGCTSDYILQHARQCNHVRGCWLIDTFLGLT